MESVPKIVVALLIAVLMAAVAYFFFAKQERSTKPQATGIAVEFLKILPEELPLEQRNEIEGLLAVFQSKVRKKELPVEDEVEIRRLLSKYIQAGGIERNELNLLMAKVGYYSFRGSTPDSLGIHPLLDDSL
jgi:hypothetical protein